MSDQPAKQPAKQQVSPSASQSACEHLNVHRFPIVYPDGRKKEWYCDVCGEEFYHLDLRRGGKITFNPDWPTPAFSAPRHEPLNLGQSPLTAFVIYQIVCRLALKGEIHVVGCPIGLGQAVAALQAMSMPPATTTLRDQFAIAALTGLIASPYSSRVDAATTLAWEIADRMLVVREKAPENPPEKDSLP